MWRYLNHRCEEHLKTLEVEPTPDLELTDSLGFTQEGEKKKKCFPCDGLESEKVEVID